MEKTENAEKMAFVDFLEKTAPGVSVEVSNLGGKRWSNNSGASGAYAAYPDIHLHCDSERCNGMRYFKTSSEPALSKNSTKFDFVTYRCKNCSETLKHFALWLILSDDFKSGMAFKFGEVPQFGAPTPARLIRLIQSDKELFLKGRRAENQGLGIAAFVYYRRVIENQKDRIFDEVIRVCQRLSADQTIIDDLTKAKSEIQFTKAVESVKHGIPQTLLVNGHNPLTLLHSALSEGIHDRTDEECLEIATSIREVMIDFSDRMGEALKDEAKLKSAVSKLLQKKSEVKPSKSKDEISEDGAMA